METLITFKTAKLLKEKEFDYKSEYYFYPNDKRDNYNVLHKNTTFGTDFENIETHYLNRDYSLVIPSPTQSLAQKWLREKYKIFINIKYDPNDECFRVEIYKTKNIGSYYHQFIKENDYIVEFSSYEEALEDGLYESLLLV